MTNQSTEHQSTEDRGYTINPNMPSYPITEPAQPTTEPDQPDVQDPIINGQDKSNRLDEDNNDSSSQGTQSPADESDQEDSDSTDTSHSSDQDSRGTSSENQAGENSDQDSNRTDPGFDPEDPDNSGPLGSDSATGRDMDADEDSGVEKDTPRP